MSGDDERGPIAGKFSRPKTTTVCKRPAATARAISRIELAVAISVICADTIIPCIQTCRRGDEYRNGRASYVVGTKRFE